WLYRVKPAAQVSSFCASAPAVGPATGAGAAVEPDTAAGAAVAVPVVAGAATVAVVLVAAVPAGGGPDGAVPAGAVAAGAGAAAVVVAAVAGAAGAAAAAPGMAGDWHMPACMIWPGGQPCATATPGVPIATVPRITNPISPFRMDPLLKSERICRSFPNARRMVPFRAPQLRTGRA